MDRRGVFIWWAQRLGMVGRSLLSMSGLWKDPPVLCLQDLLLDEVLLV